MGNRKRTCLKCGEETNIVLGADPDITGIPVCEEHKDEIQTDLMLLLLPNDEDFNEEWFNDKYNIDTEE